MPILETILGFLSSSKVSTFTSQARNICENFPIPHFLIPILVSRPLSFFTKDAQIGSRSGSERPSETTAISEISRGFCDRGGVRYGPKMGGKSGRKLNGRGTRASRNLTTYVVCNVALRGDRYQEEPGERNPGSG